MSSENWDELAEHLKERSIEICSDNNCTEDEHFCESQAYITEGGELVDICAPDFFQGWSYMNEINYGALAAITLPWTGSGEELANEVQENIEEQSY